MVFKAPIAEQLFMMRHIVDIGDLANCEAFSAASEDVVEAILGGVADIAQDVWAPLRRIGDTLGARFDPAGVRMPDGYVEAYQSFVEGGWGSIGVPVEFGGQGLPFALQTAVIETLGTANMPFSLCPTLTVGAIEALIHHGNADQRARFLPHLSSGAWTGTMNLTEPQAGTDVGALRTIATPCADGTWLIKGTKIFISFGDHDMADNIIHLVLARTPNAPAGSKGISLFLVPKYRIGADGRPGELNDVRVVSIEHKMGLHASPTCVLSFGDDDNCVGEMLGEENGGMRAMFTMMNNARLNVGVQGVQIAEGATQMAVAYARDRVQSARAGSGSTAPVPIIDHPDVRRMLMRMKALTQAARALVYYAAGLVDRKTLGQRVAADRLEILTPLAKAYGTDIANEVASLGIQIYGGMGFIEETGIAQLFRDARITPIYEGTNGVQAADLVGRKISLAGGEPLASLFSEIRSDARDARLLALVESCEQIARRLVTASPDDKLAASYPFLTMLSVATAGWLMERQMHAATGDEPFAQMKRAATRFYLEQIVPEAHGLEAAASASADSLYAASPEAFAA